MRQQFHNKPIGDHWNDYWRRCERDTSFISDASIYPLFPVDRYVRRNQRILEAGCGLGRVLKHYFYQGFAIEGFELDGDAVLHLNEEDPTLPVRVASITAMPYPDESFDLAMAFGVLSCVEQEAERELALRELRRVLKPGGILCCSVSVDNSARGVFRVIKYLEYLRGRLAGNGHRYFYSWCFSRNEFQVILSQAGFDTVEVQPILTRAAFHTYGPFFRKANGFSLALARDGDRGYALNCVGERVYQAVTKLLPWQYAEGMVFIATKRVVPIQ